MGRTLTVPEVGEILRVSRPMAYRIVNRPDFPKVMLGRSIRIPEQAFEVWLQRQTEGAEQK